MFEGQLIGIFLAAEKTGALQPADEALALPGRGLEADRYGAGAGTYSKPGDADPGREVTLIEVEALEAIARERGIELAPAVSRRNLLTRGVPLNHLVGREFTVGEVTLRGVRLCEPCEHLETLTGIEGIRAALVHRGGLRAGIVDGGTIRTGDAVLPKPDGTS